jgi:(p)ppGpp synthase/HD superfamily hydrolase
MTRAFTFWDAADVAAKGHEGQVDKLGVPYIEHPRAVALGVLQFGEDHGIAALLHDLVEDSDVTLDDLRRLGLSDRCVTAVGLLTKEKGERAQDYLLRLSTHPMACRVKIADNAHNTLPERTAQLAETADEETVARLTRKYRQAQDILWGARPYIEVKAILEVVNPGLVERLRERTPPR